MPGPSSSISQTTGPNYIIYTDIPGLSRYVAGSDGEVYSKNYNHTGRMRKLTGKIDKDGYVELLLRDNNGKRIYRRKHRLIAMAFIPNPLDLPQVNHLDGDKLNCTPNNLEWTTQSGNISHGYESGLYSRIRPIIVHNIETGVDKEYISIHEAARQLNMNHQRIFDCLKGKHNSCHEYSFKYKEGDYDA